MVRDRATENLAEISTGAGERVTLWVCKAFEETLTKHCSNLIKSVLKGKAGSCQPVSQAYCSLVFLLFSVSLTLPMALLKAEGWFWCLPALLLPSLSQQRQNNRLVFYFFGL